MNAIQRLDAEDHLMGLMVECANLGHPLKARFLQVKLSQMESLTDERLLAMTDRLSVWVAAAKEARDLAAAEGVLAAPAEVG